MTDTFRALCAELHQALEHIDAHALPLPEVEV